MNFLKRVIVIPEKLTAWAAAGILYLCVQAAVWLTNLTGIDFASLSFVALATTVSVVLTMVLKAVFEALIPESWHNIVNTFLEWLATAIAASLLLRVV